jgi:hypothetical protein
MPVAATLASFKAELVQCDELIAHAHGADAIGNPILGSAPGRGVTGS